MCETALQLWDRKLTNALGGNFCMRVGEGELLITPTLMSEGKHCRLEPKDILLIDYEAKILEGEGGLSRETDMHIGLLRDFPAIGAVIHAHPQNGMVFAAYEKPIPSVTEASEAQGAAGLIDFAPTCTPELAAAVLRYYEARRPLLEKGPLAAVMRKHGLVVTAPNLNAAFAFLEVVETDAYCALHPL
ncbi:MAG: class II aldolase/adducin family protein [Clostridiales Family XIII bacterium]|nr:class II aldolase/adducin family protein [Clostridiales Family XIII bacterium]